MRNPGLLEREGELAILAEAVARAAAGEGSVVLIEADGGLGKTSLAAAAAEHARAGGMMVLRARGSELERDFPYAVALQLLEPPARRHPELVDAAGGIGAMLASVPNALGAQAALNGLFWLTAGLAEGRPLALVVDDAHLADEASLRFLVYLATRIDELGVLVVVAARPSAADPLLLLGERALRIVPQPLGEGAIARLIAAAFDGAHPDPTFVAACAEVTRGNPLLLRELTAALAEEGLGPAARSAGRVREIGPQAVSRAVYLVLRRLPPGGTALVRALSVLDDGAPLTQVAALARLDPEEAVAVAAALASAGVLDRQAPLGFAHPIVRQSVYEELAAPERARAHRLAAELLHEAAAPAERIAAHVLKSEPEGAAWAIAALRAAATAAAARGAPAAAVRLLRRALEEGPDAEPGLLLELGRVEALIGDEAAADRLRAAAAALPGPGERADAAVALGQALWARGALAEGAETLEQILQTFAADEPARGHVEATYLSMARLLPDHQEAAGRRVRELLGRPSAVDGPPSRTLFVQVALEQLAVGSSASDVLVLTERALGEGALLAEHTSDGIVFYAAVGLLRVLDCLELELDVLEAALRDARARGSVTGYASASYCRAWNRLLRGEVDEAVADAEAALGARAEGWATFVSAAQAVLALALAERGDHDAAEQVLAHEAALDEPATLGDALALEARGRLRLAAGRPAEALADLTACGDLLVGRLRGTNPAICPWRSNAALALLALDRRDEAIALADEEVAGTTAFGAARQIGMALRARALLERGDALVAGLERAVGVLERSPSRLEYARALVDLGAARRRAGQRAAAREPLRRALDLAAGGGATALAERAREELVAAGGRPRRQRLSGPDALTPSERRVARMAAEGMTNREIAQALFVTMKAVQFHLGNVYGKLAIGSRGELAAALDLSGGG